jgi:predicted outer membrane repeat protein
LPTTLPCPLAADGTYISAESLHLAHARSLGPCRFHNNTAFVHGGAVNAVALSVVNVTSCNFTSNHALNDTRTANVTYGTFFTWSESEGGGLYVAGDGALAVSRSRFVANSAAKGAGMATVYRASAQTVTDTAFINNTAAVRGGALSTNQAGTLYTNRTTFIGNRALRASGGAIYSYLWTHHFHTHAVFRDNTTPEFGGAFYCTVCSQHGFADSAFEGNSAGVGGGALFFGSQDCGSVIRSTFVNNSASYGGAIISTKQGGVLNS